MGKFAEIECLLVEHYKTKEYKICAKKATKQVYTVLIFIGICIALIALFITFLFILL